MNRGNKRGFTLIEIMIAVSIIGLLVVLTLPSFLKARTQSQGRRTVNDARQMDSAVDQWAIDYNKKDGDPVDTTLVATYLKTPWRSKDVLGNAFSVDSVGVTQIQVHATTKTKLNGVGVDWGSY